MSANFTPTLNTYTDLTPFRFWCQKVLPLVYDDSLSYYELLCKVVDYLNKTMEDVNLSIEDVTNLHTAYEQLQAYVNNYFDNLDVQQEINNKLDQMVEDGTLYNMFSTDVFALVPSSVSSWLNEHITQETGYVIDDTLTVQGAAADAKAAGDRITGVNNTLEDVTELINTAYVTDGISRSSQGVTYESSDNTLYIYGTVAAVRRMLFLNGQNAVVTSGAAFNKTLPAGRYLISWQVSGVDAPSGGITLHYTYSNFETANFHTLISMSESSVDITFEHDVMIGLSATIGTIVGTEENKTAVTVTAEILSAVDVIAREQADKTKTAVLYTTQSLEDAQKTQAQNNIDVVSKNTLYKYNFYDVLEVASSSGRTANGITYTKNDDYSWTISGTATANSFTNIVSSQNTLPRYIQKGRKYKFNFNGGSIPIQFFWYVDGDYITNTVYTEDFEITVPDNVTGIIIRYYIAEGSTVNETVKYSFIPDVVTSIDNNYTYNITNDITENITNNTYNVEASPTITTDANGWLQSVDTDTADETGKTDMTSAIMTMLTQTGYCHLSEGIFYVSGNIDMPAHSTLCGCGEKTKIKLLNSVSNGYCVKIQKYCTIKDLSFSGSYNSISPTSDGGRNAIKFEANHHDTQDPTQEYDTELCMISNVWIKYFSGSGILCHNSNNSVSKGLYVVNSFIRFCYAGINLDYYSEFCKFTNVCITSCYYACINNGGNNVFTACTFHATNTGFYIDGTQPNSGHGTINGCTFCHIGDNKGTAIKLENVDPGFIISDCQFWYCGITVTDSSGINFIGCVFGKGKSNDTLGNKSVCASIDISGGNLVMFSSCIFHKDVTRSPKITVTNNTKTVLNNCYGSESGNMITNDYIIAG